MIQWFFFFYLLFWWVMCIFYKVTDIQNANGKIRTAVQLKPRGKFWDFIDQLFQCEFCMESHIGFCLSFPIWYYTQFWEVFFWGWCAASLSNIIKQLKPK